VLTLGGYLASRGVTRLHWVVVIGVISAVIGDNIGYWLGRRYGRAAIERYDRWVFVSPERLQHDLGLRRALRSAGGLRGPLRPGLRFLAGPLAGAMRMPPITFTLANALGALAYVPCAVGLGYAVATAWAT